MSASLRARLLWLLLAAATVGACADAPGGAAAVADSAGVRIVTNQPGSIEAADAWSLSAEPALEIGAGANPDVALFRVTAVTPLEGGRVAVATNTPPRVLVFERDGAVAAALGREGKGPGEFTAVGSTVALGGDSIAVWDPDRRRISVFGVDGRFAREVDLSGLAPPSVRAAPDAGTLSGFTRLLPGGTRALVLFGEGVFGGVDDPGTARPELPAHRIGPDGEALAAYGSFPGMTTFNGPPLGLVPLPLGARTYAATRGEELVVGTAEAPELRVFGPDGALTRIVRWPEGERAVDGPHLEKWTELVDAQPELAGVVRDLPRPERLPAFEGLVATGRGEILVGEYAGPVGVWPLRRADDGPEMMRPRLPVPERRWLVFDRDGSLTATLRTPEGFEPYAVRDAVVWGVHTDELDVESVRAYALVRG